MQIEVGAPEELRLAKLLRHDRRRVGPERLQHTRCDNGFGVSRGVLSGAEVERTIADQRPPAETADDLRFELRLVGGWHCEPRSSVGCIPAIVAVEVVGASGHHDSCPIGSAR